MRKLLPLLMLALIAAATLVTPAVAAINGGMQQSLRDFFAEGVTVNHATAELISVQRWPESKGRIHWSLPASMHGHPGRVSLIATQGKRRWYVPVQLRWMTTAVVMRKPIPARSLLSMDMMIKTRTDIAGHSGDWWQNPAELVGMRLTRPLAAGAVILTSFVKQQPMIKRGDIVTIMLDAGGIHIRAEGKALRRAARGERLQVKNLRSNEIIQVIAEKAGVVRVMFNGGRG